MPVTPSLWQEWLRLRAELTVATGDAMEQAERLSWTMDHMQRVLEAHSTLDELQAAREELEWAVYWRDQSLEHALYVDRKLDLLKAMDHMIDTCSRF